MVEEATQSYLLSYAVMAVVVVEEGRAAVPQRYLLLRAVMMGMRVGVGVEAVEEAVS